MKNLSLFVSAVALLAASSAFAAINCATLPDCDELGYKNDVNDCPTFVDGSEAVIKCPFNLNKGRCIYEAAVGQIAYFTKSPSTNSGWLLCDGQTITKAKYPDLYAFLGQQFCTANHGGTCGTDVGRVPDYRGYFLRVHTLGKDNKGKTHYSSTFPNNSKQMNTNLVTPQKEGLPNITGTFTSDKGVTENITLTDTKETVSSGSGAFYKSEAMKKYATGDDGWGYLIHFSASESNSIYGAQSGVTPPNYAVYAYIYAGRVVK